ncbi:DUF6602 domain-containing protein [Rhizobium sp. WSM1325]|uniref:DUF6602 domain-containing protein n=1 Tax=Rhizobium sp. WSM1325 TaxID=3444086 RepID=UPI000FF0505F|nr:DUF6602 domain-containing protein [Rhizobium leguminosarum]RWY66193.1 hypothetical protein EHI48_33035 [Rhizobium leguminosarum]
MSPPKSNKPMLKQHFDNLTDDLNRQSERIRDFYKTHAPSAGTNRESLVAKLLESYLLPAAGVSAGIVASHNGDYSNQCDIVLFDPLSNSPIFRDGPVPIWLLEAIYAVIEVKTQFTTTTLADTIAKCRRLKQFTKVFDDSHGRQKITDHLFVMWAFEAPGNDTAKSNLVAALSGVPQHEQPDFIIVPGRFLVRGGHYYDLSSNGQVGSAFYEERLVSVGGDPTKLLPQPFEMLALGSNTLIAFFHWLNSWLYAAGPRRPNLLAYYDITHWGTIV